MAPSLIAQHPVAPSGTGSILLCQEPRKGAKGRESRKAMFFWENMVSQFMRSVSFLCSPVHETLWPPMSVPCLGDVGGEEEQPGFTPSEVFWRPHSK